jgi:hypothetical protein
MRSIHSRMDCFVPRNDGAGVLKPRSSLRTRAVIARRAAPWQSMRSINRPMDCFVPRNDGLRCEHRNDETGARRGKEKARTLRTGL